MDIEYNIVTIKLRRLFYHALELQKEAHFCHNGYNDALHADRTPSDVAC